MLCASHRNTQGDREKNFCSVTRQKRSGNYISLVICLTSNCMRVKRAAWVCLHVCVMWGQPVAALSRVRDRLLSGEEGRACDRLQWLVELSGQNMSDSADSMNHFGLQLCNLSPTLHHITASMRLLHARLKRSRLSRLAFLFVPPVARSISSTDWWDAIKLHLHDKAFFYRKET